MREIKAGEAGLLYECLEVLAEHHNRVSVYFKGRYPQTPSGEKIISFEKELEEGKTRIAVVENNTKIVGFCKIGAHDDTGILEYLVVLKQERGKGYGAALMDWALALFRELGVSNTDVKVVFGNDTIRLYEKYGFKPRSTVLRLSLDG